MKRGLRSFARGAEREALSLYGVRKGRGVAGALRVRGRSVRGGRAAASLTEYGVRLFESERLVSRREDDRAPTVSLSKGLFPDLHRVHTGESGDTRVGIERTVVRRVRAEIGLVTALQTRDCRARRRRARARRRLGERRATQRARAAQTRCEKKNGGILSFSTKFF